MEVVQRFETCKQLRRQILRYIHLVESEQYIGGLLNANDELVKGLMAFEIMDKSIDDDSDSDNEESGTSPHMAALKIEESPPAKPPRPTSIPMPSIPTISKQRSEPDIEPEADDDDPFGDQNGRSHIQGRVWYSLTFFKLLEPLGQKKASQRGGMFKTGSTNRLGTSERHPCYLMIDDYFRIDILWYPICRSEIEPICND